MGIGCNKVKKKLISYLTRQLNEKEQNIIKHHLQYCDRCQREADELRTTWNILGHYIIDLKLPDLTPTILERIKRERDYRSLSEHLREWVARIPTPALYALSLILSILPGVLLGKSLYFSLKGPQPSYVAEVQNSTQEEVPLDIFSDFPHQSLGKAYLDLIPDSFKEEP